MKIAILSSASSGGAGIAAYRIYQAFKIAGEHEVDFFNINAFGETVCQTISPSVTATNQKITNTHFTIDHASDVRDWVVKLLSDYEVINVQWASYLVSLSEIHVLAKRGKKILFTLHDFYYITGGCHYPAGCLGYLDHCIACPQVNEKILSKQSVIDNNMLKRALFSFPNVHLSAPSQFIVENALKSNIVPKERAHVLRNSYQPIDEFMSQANVDEKRLLLIADSFKEQRKGLNLAINALKIVGQTFEKANTKIVLYAVGELGVKVTERLQGSGITVKTYGHIKEHQKLVNIFKQCQYILTCSYEDNWPNVLVESGCYGCIPIVGKWHGCEEFVSTMGLGFIAKSYTPIEFAEAINLAIKNKPTQASIEKYVDKVRMTHSSEQVISTYTKVLTESQKYTIIPYDIEESKPINHIQVSVNHLILLIQFYNKKTRVSMRILNSPFGEQKDQTQEFEFKSFDKFFHFIRHNVSLMKKSADSYGLQQFLITFQ